MPFKEYVLGEDLDYFVNGLTYSAEVGLVCVKI